MNELITVIALLGLTIICLLGLMALVVNIHSGAEEKESWDDINIHMR